MGKNPATQCSHTAFLKWLIPSHLFVVLLPKPVHQLSPFISTLLIYQSKMFITNDSWWPHDLFLKHEFPSLCLYCTNPIWSPFAREDVVVGSAVLIKSSQGAHVPSLTELCHTSVTLCMSYDSDLREFVGRKIIRKVPKLFSPTDEQWRWVSRAPKYPLLQAGALQQQLHLAWGSNINFGSDPANTSATEALSAARPLSVAASENPIHAARTAVGSHAAVALGCNQNQALCAEERWGS